MTPAAAPMAALRPKENCTIWLTRMPTNRAATGLKEAARMAFPNRVKRRKISKPATSTNVSPIIHKLWGKKIDAGEEVLITGQRELLEETGYTARHWVKLGLQHPCIGYSNEVIHMYLAQEMESGQHQRDEDESLEVFELSFGDCMEMIHQGQITDGKTIVAMMFAEHYLKHHG